MKEAANSAPAKSPSSFRSPVTTLGTSSGDERSCPPQIAYGPVQLALHCCCLWPEVPPQPLMVQVVLRDMLL